MLCCKFVQNYSFTCGRVVGWVGLGGRLHYVVARPSWSEALVLAGLSLAIFFFVLLPESLDDILCHSYAKHNQALMCHTSWTPRQGRSWWSRTEKWWCQNLPTQEWQKMLPTFYGILASPRSCPKLSWLARYTYLHFQQVWHLFPLYHFHPQHPQFGLFPNVAKAIQGCRRRLPVE